MDGLGRRPDGENRDEPAGTASDRSTFASEEKRAEGAGCRQYDAGELPAREAVVEAVSGGRGPRAETWQCGTCQRAGKAGEVSSAGAAAGAGEIRGRRGRAIWADVSSRAFGKRRRAADRRGDAAAMDAGGRVVEEATQAETVSPAARATTALWGVGADGRKFSRLVGAAWSGRLPDEHDRRRHQ